MVRILFKNERTNYTSKARSVWDAHALARASETKFDLWFKGSFQFLFFPFFFNATHILFKDKKGTKREKQKGMRYSSNKKKELEGKNLEFQPHYGVGIVV